MDLSDRIINRAEHPDEVLRVPKRVSVTSISVLQCSLRCVCGASQPNFLLESSRIMFSIVAEHDALRSKNWKNKFNKFIENVPGKVKNFSEPVTLIQAHMRAYIARKKYKQLRKAGMDRMSVFFSHVFFLFQSIDAHLSLKSQSLAELCDPPASISL